MTTLHLGGSCYYHMEVYIMDTSFVDRVPLLVFKVNATGLVKSYFERWSPPLDLHTHACH